MRRLSILPVLAMLGLFLVGGHPLAEETIVKADFACTGGKTIEATFYPGAVALKLSDGRDLTLPQAMSASGARYANQDESFVFWNKGNTAFITEGTNGEQTYADCATAD